MVLADITDLYSCINIIFLKHFPQDHQFQMNPSSNRPEKLPDISFREALKVKCNFPIMTMEQFKDMNQKLGIRDPIVENDVVGRKLYFIACEHITSSHVQI